MSVAEYLRGIVIGEVGDCPDPMGDFGVEGEVEIRIGDVEVFDDVDELLDLDRTGDVGGDPIA